MQRSDSTCWENIERAADGSVSQRGVFADCYADPLRAYFLARWAGAPLAQEVDDAIQDVFYECFKDDGVLQSVDPGKPGGFRPFLYGVAKNIALRIEDKKGRRREVRAGTLFVEGIQAPDDQRLSRIFDRTWATGIVRQAADLMEDRARSGGERAKTWVKLLRTRFEEDLPIRDIANRWDVGSAWLHHEYAHARRAFHEALIIIVERHTPGLPDEIELECRKILELLSK